MRNSYAFKTRNAPTEDEYQAYKVKMLAPFFKKYGITVADTDFDRAFVTLQREKPELFETGHYK